MLRIINQIFASVIAFLLIFQLVSPTFVSGGAILTKLKDIDSFFGLIERPKNMPITMFINDSQNISVDAALNTGLIVHDPIRLAWDNAWKAIQELWTNILASAIASFVSTILNFLLNKFQELLGKIKDWAETMFGIKLNLCSVYKAIAMKAYVFYNQFIDSVDKQSNRLTPNLNELVNNPLIDGASQIKQDLTEMLTAYQFNRASKQVDSSYSDCARNSYSITNSYNQENTTNDQQKELYEAFVGAESNAAALNLSSLNLDNSFYYTTGDFLKLANINETQLSITFNQEFSNAIGTAEKEVSEQIKKQIDEHKDQIPIGCEKSMFLQNVVTDLESYNEAEYSIVTKSFNDYKSTIMANPTIYSSYLIAVSNLYLSYLNELANSKDISKPTTAQCDLLSEVEMAKKAITDANIATKKDGSGLGNLVTQIFDQLMNLLQDFLSKMFNVLFDIINNILNKVLQEINKALASISGIGLDFSNTFNTLSDGVNQTLGIFQDTVQETIDILLEDRE